MRHGCEHTVFGSDLDGVRPCRICCHRPHVFVCAGSVLATVHLPVLTCVAYVICIMCFVTVSKLQFGQREARLRTHGFWLGFRWCSAFAHPLPPTSCFCLCRFSTCYGPLTCLDLCSVHTLCTLTVSQLQFRQREARLRTHGFWLVVCVYTLCITLCMYFNGFEAAVSAAWGTVANTRFLARI